MDKRAVLLSIKPEWCEKIIAGKKTIEIRKTAPKLEAPFVCYMYMSKHRWAFDLLRSLGLNDLADRLVEATGKVVAEFICNDVERYCECSKESERFYLREDEWLSVYPINYAPTCLTEKDFLEYGQGKNLYGLCVSALQVYEAPKPLESYGLVRAPMSWCYIKKEGK